MANPDHHYLGALLLLTIAALIKYLGSARSAG
jgi:hypothetical protein